MNATNMETALRKMKSTEKVSVPNANAIINSIHEFGMKSTPNSYSLFAVSRS